MPNLPTHLSLALQVARRMDHSTIDEHLGRFLLGSTSPDIRIMTKWQRYQTHFAPLTVEHVGTGVRGLLQAYPDLADSSRVSDETKAFLSGYFTHLVADETWILQVYRPYFGDQRLFPDQVKANIWDRALQLDMDKVSRDELGDMEQVRAFLDGSESGVGVEFISAETLGKWREWVTDFTTWEFTWERLRFAARRMSQNNGDAMQIVEEFLQCVPSSLEGVYNEIPMEEIASYREKVIEKAVPLIEEYLE